MLIRNKLISTLAKTSLSSHALFFTQPARYSKRFLSRENENKEKVAEWNKGHVPEFTESITQEELAQIKKSIFAETTSPTIKWKFDTHRGLYFYTIPKINPDIKKNKEMRKPIKETDAMVVFEFRKK